MTTTIQQAIYDNGELVWYNEVEKELTPEEIVANRIQEIRLLVATWEATQEEKEDLKLLLL